MQRANLLSKDRLARGVIRACETRAATGQKEPTQYKARAARDDKNETLRPDQRATRVWTRQECQTIPQLAVSIKLPQPQG